jgi:hypothetical protein
MNRRPASSRRCSRSCPTRWASRPPSGKTDLLRVKQTLTSTGNLEKVVRRTDLNLLVASERDLAAQVAKLRENIQITAQQDNLFEITATSGISGSPTRRMRAPPPALVQHLLDLFVEEKYRRRPRARPASRSNSSTPS